MTVNDTIAVTGTSIANGSSLTIDASQASAGAIRITELGGEAAGDIIREVDPDGDGTYEVSVTITSESGAFHSQGNELRVSDDDATRLKITNTSGSAADYYAIGYEVDG